MSILHFLSPGIAKEWFCDASRANGRAGPMLGLPGALLVTVHAQLLAPFMPVNLCLAAFLE
jgi:hypothetical protein